MKLNHATMKREMSAQRWSVTALAKEIGVERAALSSYISGRRSVPAEIFPAIARTLKVNPYVLVGHPDPAVAVAELIAMYGYDADTLADLGVDRHIWCQEATAA